VRSQVGKRHARITFDSIFQEGLARESHEVGIAFAVLGEQSHMTVAGQDRRFAGTIQFFALNCSLECDVERATNDGLDALACEGFRKLQCAEKIVRIGQRQRRHLMGQRQGRQF